MMIRTTTDSIGDRKRLRANLFHRGTTPWELVGSTSGIGHRRCCGWLERAMTSTTDSSGLCRHAAWRSRLAGVDDSVVNELV